MTKTEKKIFGENLEKELKKLDMSTRELGLRLGTSTQEVNKWVRGETFPRLQNLAGINTATGIRVSDLLKGVSKYD